MPYDGLNEEPDRAKGQNLVTPSFLIFFCGWVRLLIREGLIFLCFILVPIPVPLRPLPILLMLVSIVLKEVFESVLGPLLFASSPPDLQHPSSEDLSCRVEIVLGRGDRGEKMFAL